MHLNEWPEPNTLGDLVSPADLQGIFLNRYGDPGARGLREALANEWQVTPDEIVVSNGGTEIILDALLAYGGPGRTVLLLAPTYPTYRLHAELVGMRVATETIGIPYEIDADRLVTAMECHRPDVLVLCSPNNPTGSVVPVDAIRAAAATFPRTLVVVDEAYADFVPCTLLPDRLGLPNVAVAKTFSKIRGGAGLRLGALVGDARVLEVFGVVRRPWTVSALTQLVATRLLERDAIVLEERAERIRRERERIFEALKAHARVEVLPSVASFLMFRHRDAPAARVHAALLEQGVGVRDLASWQGAEGWLRVTVGTRAENDRFLAALERTSARVAVGP